MINNNNLFVFAGNVVKKPELRKAGETPVTDVRVAISTRLGKDKEETLFINVTCWKQNAEFACNHFDKGSRVSGIGRLKSREYEKDGNKVTFFEVEAENIGFDGPPAKKETTEPAQVTKSAVKAPTKSAAPSSKVDDENLPF